MIVIDLDLGDAIAARQLIEGQVLRRRLFVAGIRDVTPPARCVVVLSLLGRRVELAGEVVFAQAQEPGVGIGVELAPISAAARAVIDVFLLSGDLPLPDPAPPAPAADPSPAPEPELAADLAPDLTADVPNEESPAPLAVDEARDAERRGAETLALRDAMHVRMRALTGLEQRRYAMTGNLSERVMLERLYGPNVWEPLLASGRLSLPEVATIARKGTIPRPLVELIASNAGWIASGEVQRALLSNPRSSPAVISKILRMMPKHELAKVPTQTAYPISVRSAAKEMVKANRG
jgi:hypothetical protein